MERREAEEKWVDYLYGELSETERAAFEQYLKMDPDLSQEVQEYQGLRRVCRDHLPLVGAPFGLRSRVLERVGVKRSWWEAFWGHGVFRPIAVGAFTILLTLGIAYQFRDRPDAIPTVAEKAVPVTPKILASGNGDLSRQDFLAAAQASRLRMPRWNWRPQPRIASGLVSLASYGDPMMPQPYGEASGFDIRQIEQDAEIGIAQFAHQQAMRMRAMGDFRGAAQAFADLIKKYPSYPHVFAAAAQRIDCLFRIGELEIARRELSWLAQQSPFLAQAVGQRWGI